MIQNYKTGITNIPKNIYQRKEDINWHRLEHALLNNEELSGLDAMDIIETFTKYPQRSRYFIGRFGADMLIDKLFTTDIIDTAQISDNYFRMCRISTSFFRIIYQLNELGFHQINDPCRTIYHIDPDLYDNIMKELHEENSDIIKELYIPDECHPEEWIDDLGVKNSEKYNMFYGIFGGRLHPGTENDDMCNNSEDILDDTDDLSDFDNIFEALGDTLMDMLKSKEMKKLFKENNTDVKSFILDGIDIQKRDRKIAKDIYIMYTRGYFNMRQAMSLIHSIVSENTMERFKNRCLWFNRKLNIYAKNYNNMKNEYYTGSLLQK